MYNQTIKEKWRDNQSLIKLSGTFEMICGH